MRQTYWPGPETVKLSEWDSFLPLSSLVQMAPWSPQLVVTSRTTVTAAARSARFRCRLSCSPTPGTIRCKRNAARPYFHLRQGCVARSRRCPRP